jgi:hypothetical protein
MGFGPSRMDRGKRERPWKIHPIWRGIGCFFILLIPIMSYVGADLFIRYNRWFPMPEDLRQPILIPYTQLDTIDVLIDSMNGFLGRLIYANLFFTLVFLFLGFGVLSILYSILYRIVGPPRYGRFDSPPVKSYRRRQ